MSVSSKFLFVFFLLIVLIICNPAGVIAQPGFDPGVPDGAPVDGGLSMLAIAGVSYAAKKYYDKRKQSKSIAEE